MINRMTCVLSQFTYVKTFKMILPVRSVAKTLVPLRQMSVFDRFYCKVAPTYPGVLENPLKYNSHVERKKSTQAYGIQGTNHLIPEKGKIAGPLPMKVALKKDVVYSWCCCGYSHNQPFCDGSHKKAVTNLKPVRYISDKDLDVWLCVCKQTDKRPFCDGTHKKLPPPPATPTGRAPN